MTHQNVCCHQHYDHQEQNCRIPHNETQAEPVCLVLFALFEYLPLLAKTFRGALLLKVK